MRKHKAAAAEGTSSSASKMRAARPLSPAGHPADTGCSHPCVWEFSQKMGNHMNSTGLLELKSTKTTSLARRTPRNSLLGTVLCIPKCIVKNELQEEVTKLSLKLLFLRLVLRFSIRLPFQPIFQNVPLLQLNVYYEFGSSITRLPWNAS